MPRALRRVLLSLLAVAVASVAIAPWLGEATAQQREREAAVVAPRPQLVAHEWGVWKLQQGRVAHIEELAAECPPFVVGVRPRPPIQINPPPPFPRPQPPLPVIQPPIDPRPHPVARKPVLFLYTDTPLDVTVEVGFEGGEPWLYYPAAEVTRSPTGGGLRWEGRLIASGRTILAAPGAGHWWNDLRAVNAATFLANTGTAESFLFYDGPVRFERPFLLTRQNGGALVTPMSAERTLFLVESGRYVEHDVEPDLRGAGLVAQGDMAMLRARLDELLRGRGLKPTESRALLETWRDDLFANPRPLAVYFVPRDLYDRMLPLTITPVPDELVRVGLVIDELSG